MMSNRSYGSSRPRSAAAGVKGEEDPRVEVLELLHQDDPDEETSVQKCALT